MALFLREKENTFPTLKEPNSALIYLIPVVIESSGQRTCPLDESPIWPQHTE